MGWLPAGGIMINKQSAAAAAAYFTAMAAQGGTANAIASDYSAAMPRFYIHAIRRGLRKLGGSAPLSGDSSGALGR